MYTLVMLFFIYLSPATIIIEGYQTKASCLQSAEFIKNSMRSIDNRKIDILYTCTTK